MVPLRPASLFQSRWSALLYAAGVLWFAADVSGLRDDPAPANIAAPDPATPDNASLESLEAQVHAFEKLK